MRELLIKKDGFNVKTKSYSIGIHATIIFPNKDKDTGNVFVQEQRKYLKRINEIIKNNNITELTKNGEKVSCQFIKNVRRL